MRYDKEIKGHTIIWQAVNVNQYIAWRFLDGKFCMVNHMTTRPAPMPHQAIGKN